MGLQTLFLAVIIEESFVWLRLLIRETIVSHEVIVGHASDGRIFEVVVASPTAGGGAGGARQLRRGQELQPDLRSGWSNFTTLTRVTVTEERFGFFGFFRDLDPWDYVFGVGAAVRYLVAAGGGGSFLFYKLCGHLKCEINSTCNVSGGQENRKCCSTVLHSLILS